MSGYIPHNQATSFGNYLMFVENAAREVPHAFIKTLMARICRAFAAGEPPDMLAEEIQFRFRVHIPPRKSAKELAIRYTVVK